MKKKVKFEVEVKFNIKQKCDLNHKLIEEFTKDLKDVGYEYIDGCSYKVTKVR